MKKLSFLFRVLILMFTCIKVEIRMVKQPQGLKSKSMAPFCFIIKYLVKENVRLRTEVTMAKNWR